MTLPFLSLTARVLYMLSLRTCAASARVELQKLLVSWDKVQASAFIPYRRCISALFATFASWGLAWPARVVRVFGLSTVDCLGLDFSHLEGVAIGFCCQQ